MKAENGIAHTNTKGAKTGHEGERDLCLGEIFRFDWLFI